MNPTVQKNRKAGPRHVDPHRTKFDIWLDRCCVDRTPITIILSFDPVDETGDQNCPECVRINQVDRYMILVEFNDGSCWWIPKDGILGATTAA